MSGWRVAIVGSADPSRNDYERSVRNTTDAEAACEAIGEALAEAGSRMIVYSAAPGFIEGAVVRGFVNSADVERRRELIEVVFPADKPEAAGFPELRTHPHLFRLRRDTSSDWEIAFYRSLGDADAVFLLGGGQSTLIAGIMAKTFEKPLLALSHFGGSAETIWRSLVPERDLPSSTAIEDMAGPLDKDTSRRLIAALHEQDRKQRRRSRQRSGVIHAAIAVSLLLAWVITLPVGYLLLGDADGSDGSVEENPAFIFLLFLAPVLAGISGATVRMARPYARESASSSTVLGAGAGAAAGLLYLASQMVGGASLYNFAWLLFASLFGFVGGLTFDRVFRRLEETDVVRSETLTP